MIWRKQILMLPLLLLLHVHGMDSSELQNRNNQVSTSNRKYCALELNNRQANWHHVAVNIMMEKVQEELDAEKHRKGKTFDGILKLFEKYDKGNANAQDSRAKCESASEAIKEYFRRTGGARSSDMLKAGFKYLEDEASYDDITTILFIASSIKNVTTGVPKNVCLIKEKWDVTKLFQLKNDKKNETVASLTHDKYIHGFRRCLKKGAKGKEAFRVYTMEAKNCSGNYWDPDKAEVKSDLDKRLLDENDEKVEIILEERTTKNGDYDSVYYDPVQGANQLELNLYWMLKSWFFLWFGMSVMKQYLDPNDMEYKVMSLMNFANGKVFLFMLFSVVMESIRYLNVMMTNDGKKLIIPETKKTDNLIYKAKDFELGALRDLTNVCLIVPGVIAHVTLRVSTVSNLIHLKDKEKRVDALKRMAASLIPTFAIFGAVFLNAIFAFLIASQEREGGLFTKFNKACYEKFGDVGSYTDIGCFEILAGRAVLFWLPGMTEGWTDTWMPLSTVVGGLVWFLPGLLLKVFKIIMIEPMLLSSAFLTAYAFVWLYKRYRPGCKIPFSNRSFPCFSCRTQQPREMRDDIALHTKHNLTKSFLQIGEAGILYYSLQAVLMGIFKWKELYMFAFCVYALAAQAFYYVVDLIPTNNFTRHISPAVAIFNGGFLSPIIYGLFVLDAGTTGGEGSILPFISASVFNGQVLQTMLVINVLGVIVKLFLMAMGWLWYNPENQNKRAYEYMIEFSDRIIKSGLKDNLMPKGWKSWFVMLFLNFWLLAWFILRAFYHHPIGESY